MFKASNDAIYEVQVYPEHLQSYQLELFEYIFGFQIEIDNHFCNPFRDDRTPNACIKKSIQWSNSLVLFDIRGWTGLTAFTLLSRIKGKSNFYKELNYFWYRYLNKTHLPIVTNISYRKQSTFEIKYTPINYTDETLAYWDEYNIDKEYLKSNLVYPISEYWYTSNKRWKYIKVKERCYAIPLHGKTKLYFVDRDKTSKRFITDYESGWSETNIEIGDDNSFIIGCTSFKDKAVVECNTDYRAVFLKLGENYIPSKEESLHINLYIGDNDEAGIKYTDAFRVKTGIKSCVPEIEGYDVADLAKSGNIDYLTYLIENDD